MCTFLFFPLFLRSLSRCLHTQVSFSLPFFFFWFFIFVGYFFFSVRLFYIFLSFFFLAPFNSRFVFASFYREKKKKNITVISHVQESQMETVFGVLDVKKRKGREGRNRPNRHVFQCMSSKWSSSPPGRKTTSSFFFFSSQESTTSGCSLTSFPPPPFS